MKYIRTKNNRISYLISEPNEEITEYEIVTSKGTNTCCREDEVVKIADNIEELCDEALFFDKDGKPNYLSNQSEGFWILGANLFRDSVRLAILTNTGLKYVAKLNKEGEFELL